MSEKERLSYLLNKIPKVNSFDALQMALEVKAITKNMKNKSKLLKSEFVKNQAKSDQFWKRKFMQVLEAMEYGELTHARDYWGQFGVSDHEAKLIEKEFERQKAWRAAREGEMVSN